MQASDLPEKLVETRRNPIGLLDGELQQILTWWF